MNNLYVVEIHNEQPTVIDATSGSYSDLPNISLEIINTEKLLPSDLPIYTGTIQVSQISDLDDRINNALEIITIDGGSP